MVVDMHTRVRRGVWPGMNMLLGLSFTPARRNGCQHERADPYVHASVHRSRGKGNEVYWRADLGHLRFLWRV
eukprot:3863506-Pleurochrysis_carterae.AAC.1